MKTILFMIALPLSGCANYQPIAGMPQDGDPHMVASACWREAFDVVKPTDAAFVAGVIGGAIGGALAGSMDDDRQRRTQWVTECIARHGWIDVSGN